jgi:DNA-binding NtrC family response regulator
MTEPKLRGRSILVVEDQPLISMDVAKALMEAGALVATTMTLKQALILVEHDGISAAVVDHALGDGDSGGLYTRLKERNIPFIIYTGFSEIKGACHEAPHLNKPATDDVLVTAVESLLQGKPRSA